MKTREFLIKILGAFVGVTFVVGGDLFPLSTTKLTIIDEAGQPIKGAQVEAYCYHFPNEKKAKDSDVSDDEGISLLKLRALRSVDVTARKKGYYLSMVRSDKSSRDERLRFDSFVRDGVDPRNRDVEPPMKKEVKLEASVTLREIKTPHPPLWQTHPHGHSRTGCVAGLRF
jgi:hypothetical protein